MINNIKTTSLSYSFRQTNLLFVWFDAWHCKHVVWEISLVGCLLLVEARNQREIIRQMLERRGGVQKIWKIASFAWWKASLLFTANTWRKFSRFFIRQKLCFCSLRQKKLFPEYISDAFKKNRWNFLPLAFFLFFFLNKTVTVFMSDQTSPDSIQIFIF